MMLSFKKLGILLTLLILGYATTQAQVAIKAGVNFANMKFEEENPDIEDLARNGSIGFTGGLVFLLPIGDVFAVQPELLFSQKGAESSYTVLGQTFTSKLTYNYIDIPLLLRLSLGETYGEGLGLYVNGGGYVGYALNGKNKFSNPITNGETDITFDDVDDQRRVDFGVALGAGVTLGNLFFDLRYNHGLNDLLDDDANNSNDNGIKKLQHRGLALTAGIAF